MGGGDVALSETGWPGHFYIWVEDIRKTLHACQKLGEELGVGLVEDLQVGIHSKTSVDSLTLVDPAQRYRFGINQAPKALGRRMRKRALPTDGPPVPRARESGWSCCRRRDVESGPSLLGLVEVVRTVQPGTSDQIVHFYADCLGAAISKTDDGLAVHFSLGGALNQRLMFAEDECLSSEESKCTDCDEICIYLPSQGALQAAFKRCLDLNILRDGSTLEAAESKCEFCFTKITEVASRQPILEMMHRVRSPDYPEFPSVQRSSP